MPNTRSSTDQEVIAGQAVYSKKMLYFYDWLVLYFSNRLIWRNPTPALIRFYNESITQRHLDVGVGTGYFLDKCSFPEPNPDIVLMDMNNNCLAASADRIRRYQPKCYIRNVLEPVELPEDRFSSIALNYLFHCIPGTIEEKAVAFDHLLPHLAEGGVIFGSTLLHSGVRKNRFARKLMAFYNSKGIFHNEQDDLAGLETALKRRFKRYEIEVHGCAVWFRGWK